MSITVTTASLTREQAERVEQQLGSIVPQITRVMMDSTRTVSTYPESTLGYDEERKLGMHLGALLTRRLIYAVAVTSDGMDITDSVVKWASH